MAGTAESRNARDVQVVVEARNTLNVERGVVEQFFAALNRSTLGSDWVLAVKPQPRPIQVKDLRGERGTSWILPQWVVHADEEEGIGELQRQRNRPTCASIVRQVFRFLVEGLGGEQAGFERDDL